MTCPKIQYPSRRAANRSLKYLRWRKGGYDSAHAYRCPNCRKWHIGNRVGRAEGLPWAKLREGR
jgi:hypothetical protein